MAMKPQVQVEGWPALLSREMACRYLSCDARSFRATTARFCIPSVAIDEGTALWRRSGLDRLVRRLPESLPEAGTATARTIALDVATIAALAETLAQRLATRTPAASPALVSISDAARLLGVGRSTLYRLIGDGRLEMRKIGRRTLVVRTGICPPSGPMAQI